MSANDINTRYKETQNLFAHWVAFENLEISDLVDPLIIEYFPYGADPFLYTCGEVFKDLFVFKMKNQRP